MTNIVDDAVKGNCPVVELEFERLWRSTHQRMFPDIPFPESTPSARTEAWRYRSLWAKPIGMSETDWQAKLKKRREKITATVRAETGLDKAKDQRLAWERYRHWEKAEIAAGNLKYSWAADTALQALRDAWELDNG